MDTISQLKMKLKVRRSTINVLGASLSQTIEEKEAFPFSQGSSFKPWNSMEHLDSPISVTKCPKGHIPRWRKETLRPQQNMNINVGGKVFYIPKKMAVRFPRTRIGSLALCTDRVKQLSLCDDYSVLTNEFFFDRDPMFFYYIFHFYRSGVLWVMQELCPFNFEEEMLYWGLSWTDTQSCCRILFEEKVDEMRDNLKIEEELMAEIAIKYDEEGYKTMFLGGVRKKLWELMENPYSSLLAKVFAIVSSLLVLISIVALTLNTVEELRTYTLFNKTYMEWVETFSILFFTFEYFLRLFTTCDIKHFVKSVLNLMDLVAITPYFIQLIFETFAGTEDPRFQEDLKTLSRASKVLKVVKLMRIFRILKLARHSTGMRAFGFTLRQCYQQVCCLLLFIAMGIFTFSALLHSVERDTEGSQFSSIPDTWWWATVSISQVGYGDMVPVSLPGRMVAFVCIFFGIILNGMPISLLFNKFSDYYGKLKYQESSSTSVKRRMMLKERLRCKLDELFSPSVGVNGKTGAPEL
ncbi:potassium voltage-gated channel subfamily V member 2 [Esox lucius]|uniref:Uncharacterized protein n=1 Tax=Esox lucius TaxID=8010 RepID=A0A3P8ZEK3_ESOLU|nr:potassium voltage-gated channel subfamily V member 2 [Esox lucius]